MYGKLQLMLISVIPPRERKSMATMDIDLAVEI